MPEKTHFTTQTPIKDMSSAWLFQSYGDSEVDEYCIVIANTQIEALNEVVLASHNRNHVLYPRLQRIYEDYKYFWDRSVDKLDFPTNGCEFQDMIGFLNTHSYHFYTFDQVPLLSCNLNEVNQLKQQIKQLEHELQEEKLRPPELGGSDYEKTAKHFSNLQNR